MYYIMVWLFGWTLVSNLRRMKIYNFNILMTLKWCWFMVLLASIFGSWLNKYLYWCVLILWWIRRFLLYVWFSFSLNFHLFIYTFTLMLQRRSCRALLRELISLTLRMLIILNLVSLSFYDCFSINSSIIVCRYIYHLTLGGFALTFPLDGIVEKQPDAHLIDNASDMTKINLRAIVFR